MMGRFGGMNFAAEIKLNSEIAVLRMLNN